MRINKRKAQISNLFFLDAEHGPVLRFIFNKISSVMAFREQQIYDYIDNKFTYESPEKSPPFSPGHP